MKIRTTGDRAAFMAISYTVVTLLAIICLVPFLMIVTGSFTAEEAIYRDGFRLIPKEWSLESYRLLLEGGVSLARAYQVTAVLTVVGTALSLLISSMTAYVLYRRDFPWRNKLSFFFYFTTLFSGGLVPSYIMWTQTFHIRNTLFALLIPNLLMSAFNVIMMRTYFTTNIPDAVIEAARIDGAGELRILLRVVMPMSVPIIVTLALLVGLGYWNDWLNGLYYINEDRLYSIQVLLNKMLMDVQFLMSNTSAAQSLQGQDFTLPSTGIKMAVAVMGALPVLVIYPFFQKYFVKGIIIGAVKG